MNRYHNGKIYKLVNTVDDRIYVGSTAMPLSKRLSSHKLDARRQPERRVCKELNTVGWFLSVVYHYNHSFLNFN